jgi:hypothetical protein
MKTNKIYYKHLGPRGLFNQVLSLETAVGIQHKTNTDIVFYDDDKMFWMNKPSNYDEKYSEMISKQTIKRISDIFSWDSQNNFIFDSNITQNDLVNVNTYDMANVFLVDKNKNIDNIDEFAGTRYPIYFNGNDINFINTLVSYSYFFYHRDLELDKKISSVSAKDEYKDLAKKIANSLGDFDGIHLRMTDFPIYVYRVTEKMFSDSINSFNSGRRIVVSTDDPDNQMLKNMDSSAIFLDKYIYENFFDDFKSLPISNEIVFGLINNLVMHYSKDFIGTPGSTYTSYIQKNRINMGLDPSWKFFNDLDYKKTGKYSWTRYPIADNAKGWWREWEECLLIKS